ncbi:sugar phosphate isomerase/epimerase family protein [Methanobacterium sp. ACI-7]|uniref:sugar phosphate isomerase/epimerase family protein n=1 Tax=unclassified Methanobacterium TaxID=2627676 RepID=UPI0039C04CA1
MKIGVSTLALFPMPLDEIFEYLESIKVEYVEIMKEYPYHKIDPELVNSYNLKTSVHSPLSDINVASLNESVREASIKEIKESIDIASQINASVVVAHPGHAPFLSRSFRDEIMQICFKSLKECQEYAKDQDIELCIENMPDMEGMICNDLEELYELTSKIGTPMTLDVGHAHNMGLSIDEIFKYDSIGHIHLSDNDGSFDNHDALGTKNIDFKSLFKGLKKIKFDGICVIEVKEKEEILESFNYIKSILKN